MTRRAAFGDVHGRMDLLTALYAKLQWESLDEIWSLGDLIDRGPESAACVQFCRENNIKTVMGNHEGAMLSRYIDQGRGPKHGYKRESYKQLIEGPVENITWMRSLPYLEVFYEDGYVFTHSGIDPFKPFYEQSSLCCHVAMVHPNFPGKSRWYRKDRKNVTEEQMRAEGWKRWYEIYDGDLDIIIGHTGVPQPEIVECPNGKGKVYFLDTQWNGALTACVFPERKFIQALGPRPGYIQETFDE